MSTDCLFCRIAAGEIPSTEVLATETVYAFRDIEPKAPTHVLVVPRKHITDADHISGDDAPVVADMLSAAREIARKEGLTPNDGGNGYRLVFNVGDDAGNTVPHLHLHVIGGRSMSWPPG